MLIPLGPGHEVGLVMAEEHGGWVAIQAGGSEMQVQAFAAPRSGSLWDEVRAEIAGEVAAAGGSCTEADGTFGTVLNADLPVQPGQPDSGMNQVRFIGVDGPRWFLRGLIAGPAAAWSGSPESQVLEAVFRQIVVVRGEHPMPPRDLLELTVPPEAQQAAEQQAAGQAAGQDASGQDASGQDASGQDASGRQAQLAEREAAEQRARLTDGPQAG